MPIMLIEADLSSVTLCILLSVFTLSLILRLTQDCYIAETRTSLIHYTYIVHTRVCVTFRCTYFYW